MKKIIKIIIGILVISITIILYISYMTDYNQQVLENTTQEIKKNYPISEDVNTTNEYGNYYIITTNTKVIVLTKDFKEEKKEDIAKLKEMNKDMSLIYKTNKLMYEKKIVKNKKVIYEYYDALSGEKVKTTTLELK